ncbi:MAG TPA: glycoside hydrolase family 76 protein [Bacilli bacterium]
MIKNSKFVFRMAVIIAVAIVLFVWGTGRMDMVKNKGQVIEQTVWNNRADQAQAALSELYWNQESRMFDNVTLCLDLCNEQFHYWWQAHAVDVLVDGYIRTKDESYSMRIAEMDEGLMTRNGGALPNEFYDDMEWMALAFLRAYDATDNETYKAAVFTLWEDIKTGWNEQSGGGIAWKKTQLDYKNTPANAPAVILAARLYRRFGNEQDLEWAKRIYSWQKNTLVDPESGFVWDGINRNSDGFIDKTWEFTYCQGVYIGAGVELYRTTMDQAYLQDAIKTANAAKSRLTSPITGVLPSEGKGDGGLFKGILIRYLAELIVEDPTQEDLVNMLQINANSLWNDGKAADQVLFSNSWNGKPEPAVDLSTQLSGIMLLEQLALLESKGSLQP